MRYAALTESPLQFLETTGVPPEELEKVLPEFTAAYDALYSVEAASDASPSAALPQMEDKLLFIWLAHKMHASPSELAHQFGMTPAQVGDCLRCLLPVLQLAFSRLAEGGLTPDEAKFLQLLNTHRVEYLVVGGHAVAFHGYRRPILDLDVFVATDTENAHKLVKVLDAFGGGGPPNAHEFFQTPERVIRLGQPPFSIQRHARGARFIQLGTGAARIEILTSISAVSFEACYPERVAGVIAGVPVQVIGLAQLKRNKAAGIREKDADDLVHLSE